MRRTNWIITALAFIVTARLVQATPITFTYSSTGTGRLGELQFTDAAFTFAGIGDTADRFAFNDGFSIVHRSGSVSISGVGVFTLLLRTYTSVDNGRGGETELSAGPLGSLVFGPYSVPALSTWDMLTSIGPVTGPGTITQLPACLPLVFGDGCRPVITSAGELILNSSNANVTFQATIVPEMKSWALIALGLLGFAVVKGPMIRHSRRSGTIGNGPENVRFQADLRRA